MSHYTVAQLLESIERPPCPKCGTTMGLRRIEPDKKDQHDLGTFECPKCQHAQSMVVKYVKVSGS
jgi:hypothetical protein